MLASDEAYSEIYFGEPPASALQVADRTNVLAFNTLSKRSSMPGYRSGFVAGDPELIAALKRYRPNVGVAPQEFIQRAAIAAWGDEAHVDEVRERYRAKREAMCLEALPLRNAGGDASFFLWLEGGDELAARLLDAGVVVAPGLVLRRPGLLPARAGAAARDMRAGGVNHSHAERRSGRPSGLSAAAPRPRRCASCAGTAARSPRSARGP